MRAASHGQQTLSVTALVPAHNRAEQLPRALASIAAQTVLPAEILVVDDGSIDGTAAVARRFGARVVRHARNRGVAAARNTGIAEASQPWVAMLDSDDEWLPHHLATLWDLRGPHDVVAGTALRCGSDPDGDSVQGPAGAAPIVLASPEQLVFPGNIIATSATMARRDVMRAVGGFRKPDGVEDFDMWIRAIDAGSACLSPRVTVIYHEEGATQLSGRIGEMQRGHLDVAARYEGRPWWSPGLVERWRASAAWNDVRTAVRNAHPIQASRLLLWLCADRERLRGLAGTWAFRLRLRRASGRVARDGGPTFALLPGATADGLDSRNGVALVDLTGRSQVGAYVRLVRRPTAGAVAPSAFGGAVAAALGIPLVGAPDSKNPLSKAVV